MNNTPSGPYEVMGGGAPRAVNPKFEAARERNVAIAREMGRLWKALPEAERKAIDARRIRMNEALPVGEKKRNAYMLWAAETGRERAKKKLGFA